MTRLEQLARLCRDLGSPQRDLAILAEGNASCRVDDATLAVTRSGSRLEDLTSDDLVEVPLAECAALARSAIFERSDLAALARPRADGSVLTPSIETVLHAIILERTGASFVGHTHPTSVLGLLCSVHADDAFAAPIFPDEVVVCGPSYLVVPYASPGPALAHSLDARLVEHLDSKGEWPRAILLANHGMLALGSTPAEVLAVTAMTEKSARVRLGALSIGGYRALPQGEADALLGRDDERLRRELLIKDDA